MTGLYEDMGNILGRYYQIGESEVSEDSEVKEVENMMFREDDDYKAFLKKL